MTMKRYPLELDASDAPNVTIRVGRIPKELRRGLDVCLRYWYTKGEKLGEYRLRKGLNPEENSPFTLAIILSRSPLRFEVEVDT